MDYSKEYVLMCQKAEEIQQLRPLRFQPGDIIYHNGQGPKSIGRTVWFTIAPEDYTVYKATHNDWIPRQDELQDMIDLKRYYKARYSTLHSIFNVFATRVNGYKVKPRISEFTSFEQLWLALVMFENYDKKWDFENKQWVCANKKEGFKTTMFNRK